MQTFSILVGFLAFAMAGSGTGSATFDSAGRERPVSAHPAKIRGECGGRHREGGDAVYRNCATHPVKVEISHYIGADRSVVCVPARGRYHSSWWNTKDQRKIADSCD